MLKSFHCQSGVFNVNIRGKSECIFMDQNVLTREVLSDVVQKLAK